MNFFLSVSQSVCQSVTLVRFCVPPLCVSVSPPVRFCVPPPFAFIIYNPTMELGGVLVPTYRNRVVIFILYVLSTIFEPNAGEIVA